jgi:hypothetical protein
MEYDKKINGNLCIRLLNECINNSSNTYEQEWSKLKWENGIDLESMNYDDAIKIAKIIGLDKNSVETVISSLNNKYNKNISYSVKMTFQAIKNKILKNNLMIGGDDNNLSTNFIQYKIYLLQNLLSNIGKQIDKSDLTKIKMLIDKKTLIDNKYDMILDKFDLFITNFNNKKISIPDNMKELTLQNIDDFLKTVN